MTLANNMPTAFKDKPMTQTSDQRHWYNAFQPLEYRGFSISRDLEYQNLWTITQHGKQVTGLHGRYNGLEHSKRMIDNFIDMKKSNANNQAHTE
jgi:hypothetical protein